MTILKTLTADLQSDVTGSYDQTKTTIAGFVYAQTVNGVAVLAPPKVRWVDVFTDSGETIQYAALTSNSRLFGITTPATGTARIVCFDFNLGTGVASYRGKLTINVPNTAATTHTLRGFDVDDSDVANIKAMFTTNGSVLINGGLFSTNKVPLTDFMPTGFPTILFGVGSDAKGVYFHQDPAFIGSTQLNIAAAALALEKTGKKAVVHNGISATHQFFIYDYSIAPNCPQSTVTMTIATPGVVSHTGHTFLVNDPIVFSTTGALPTGVVAGTVYFAKTIVAGVSYEISATSGGASIATTGTQSGVHSVSRAFGTTGSTFVNKTGNLPALTGTLLLLNSELVVTPAHSTNSGSLCVFFATTSNLYLGKLSELTSNATTWPSLITVNLLGTVNQLIAPVAINATWDTANDRAVFTTSTVKVIAKKMLNNVIEDIFGLLNNDYLEALNPATTVTQFGALALTQLTQSQGWTFLIGSTVGQRGIIALNSGASYRAGTSYIITKVLNTSNTLSYSFVALSKQLSEFSSSARISYRTSGFGTATGGWTFIASSNSLSNVVPAAQIQFKLEFDPIANLENNVPNISELFMSYLESISMSDNWRGSVANSSQPSASPFYVAFRLQKAYASVVPRMYVTITDDSGAISRYDTVTHAANFSYSANNGTTWNSLGTISNTALVTELRLNITSPSGNPITAGILEY